MTSNDKTPVMELWGIWSTPTLPLLPGPHRLRVVVSDGVLSMGQIELFEYLIGCKQMNYVESKY